MPELMLGGLTISTDDRDRVHFWGEVFNLTDETQRWVRVTARLLDARGETLAEQSDIVGLEWTLPRARNPFYLRFAEPPHGWHRYALSVSGVVHDYHDASAPQPHTGLIVDRLHYREIGRASLHCSIIGLLSNKGLAPATHVKVAATLYDPDGKVVAVQSPYLVPHGLFSPGDELPFECKFYALGGLVADYQVQVQGRVYAPTQLG